jgi:molybdopterin converting factor small subunit
MIQVNVKCFSQVKYALETDEIKLELEAGTTTVELEKIIREKASGKLDKVSLRVAINQKYVPNETELIDGDEVVFIPPVQGG